MSKETTVETFSLSLPEEVTLEALETKLLQALPQAKRLLRWAIVRVEGLALHCEGAYLKKN